MRCDDCRELLGAHADQELAPNERAAVATHLAACRECAAEYDAMRDVSRRVKSALAPRKVPDVLVARIRGAVADGDARRGARETRPLPWPRLAAAGVLIAALSSAATWAVVRHDAPHADEGIEREVVASHIRALMPGHLTDVASNDQHNVKPWFDGRVDLSPAVPRLDSLGFPLLGGRLDYVGGRTVPVVVYGRRKHVIDVFAWPTPNAVDRTEDAFTANGYHVLRWTRNGEAYRAVSDIGIDELRQFVAMFVRADSASASRRE